MKTILLLTIFLCLAMAYCDSLEYWKGVKSDPLNWVDRDLPREFVDNEDLSHITRWNKDDPNFRKYDKEWKEKNFKRKNSNLGRSWRNGDAPDLFFGYQSYISNLSKLPLSGQALTEPWSSYYWPIEYGILSARYADNEKNTFFDVYGNNLTWKESVNMYKEPKDYMSNPTANYINTYFSPAEKYDVLVGDTSAFTLTNNNKNQGKSYEDSKGDVESWMGICHGWAAAAFSLARPEKDVTLIAADGKTQVKFFADDIKGLASLKYADSSFENLFAGGRCNTVDNKITKDRDSGLVIDYDCFDINPGSWVIILANRLGINKKSFVIDATFDAQVWNQPMYSYSMSYFNILSDISGGLEESKVKPSDIVNSREAIMKFISKMVSPKASHIVGVSMDITYMVETAPRHGTPTASRRVKANYVFTLELDDQNNILGGEWLHNKHPDFVWAPADGAKPFNDEDNQIASSVSGNINSVSVLRQLTQYAASASSRGEVLDIIVQYLVDRSSKGGYLLGENSVEEEYNRLRDTYEHGSNGYSNFLSIN